MKRTEREQVTLVSFGNNSWVCLQNQQKTVFWQYLNIVKILFLVSLMQNRRIIPKTYLGKLLTFCPVNLSLKSLLYGKNQGGDTFGKNDCVLIVGTFFILRAIGYLIFLNAMFLFKYIKEVNFGQTICNFATGLWKLLKMRRPPLCTTNCDSPRRHFKLKRYLNCQIDTIL
jgi:hypothetical protein